jgi:hypothetical protein
MLGKALAQRLAGGITCRVAFDVEANYFGGTERTWHEAEGELQHTSALQEDYRLTAGSVVPFSFSIVLSARLASRAARR